MGGDSQRKLKPMTRNHRPVNSTEEVAEGPKNPLEAALEIDGQWVVEGGLASRLFQKSALGKPLSGGKLALQPSELMFCHWHRHLPLPSNDWVAQQMTTDDLFMHRCAALEAVRDGGEKVVLFNSLKDDHKAKCTAGTWALRWNRNQHPSRDEPLAQVRWFASQDLVGWRELLEWGEAVQAQNHKAEILVVDGEFDVTIYRLEIKKIAGNMALPDLDKSTMAGLEQTWAKRKDAQNGVFMAMGKENWPLPTVGVAQMNGTWLNSVEAEWLDYRLNQVALSELGHLYSDLLSRGLLCRPGFKYGCRWRLSCEPMGEAHAPWLLSPEDEAPSNWDGACLAVRLAAGVHKKWLCALHGEEWQYLSIERILIGRD